MRRSSPASAIEGNRSSRGPAKRRKKSGSNAALKPGGSSAFDHAIATRFPSRRTRTPLSASMVIGITGGRAAAGPAHEDVPAHGLDGHVDARERRHPPRPGPRRDDDGARRDVARVRLQQEARARARDRRHARAVERPHARTRRLAQEEVREAARVDEAVPRAEGPARDGAGGERRAGTDAVRVEDLDRDAARALERRGGLHRGEPPRVTRQEEVAGLAVERRLADLGRERVEDLHRRERHRDVDVRRELRADAAVGLRRRARAGQSLPLEEEDARRPEPGEVERDARADDPRPDDRDVRALRHRRGRLSGR